MFFAFAFIKYFPTEALISKLSEFVKRSRLSTKDSGQFNCSICSMYVRSPSQPCHFTSWTQPPWKSSWTP